MPASDPVKVTGKPYASLDFAGALGEMTDDQLEALLQELEAELAQPNARGQIGSDRCFDERPAKCHNGR